MRAPSTCLGSSEQTPSQLFAFSPAVALYVGFTTTIFPHYTFFLSSYKAVADECRMEGGARVLGILAASSVRDEAVRM